MRIFFLLYFSLAVFIQVQAQTTPDTSKVYTYNIIPPQFPGGDKALAEFIKKNIILPNDGRTIKGTVYIYFYVEIDGSLSDINVVPNKGLDPAYDQAAIDVISKSPKWKPGELDGKISKIKKVVPIKFGY